MKTIILLFILFHCSHTALSQSLPDENGDYWETSYLLYGTSDYDSYPKHVVTSKLVWKTTKLFKYAPGVYFIVKLIDKYGNTETIIDTITEDEGEVFITNRNYPLYLEISASRLFWEIKCQSKRKNYILHSLIRE